jgi:tRNA (Thr-GGU) A37 N-methylase
MEAREFPMRPIGFVRGPYTETSQIPKGSKDYELKATPPSDDRPHGVFATRSPRRPNPIGITVVELLRRDGRLLHVRGLDMVDGTPILDLKPYLSSVPPEKLRRGWVAEAEARSA